MSEAREFDPEAEEVWRNFLMGGEEAGAQRRRFVFGLLPREPRCKFCYAPFEGLGGTVVRTIYGKRQSRLNPHLCSGCEDFAKEHQGGVELELAMLFADVRGSTALAEKMQPAEFSRLINRFYKTGTDVLIQHDALIDKLAGDQLAGFFVEGLAGPEYSRRAVEAARQLVHETSHWLSVGAGVHTGLAFVGSVGTGEGTTDITALGDAVNTAARLSSEAGPGEVLVSVDTLRDAQWDAGDAERRHLTLKGRTEPVDVAVLRVD